MKTGKFIFLAAIAAAVLASPARADEGVLKFGWFDNSSGFTRFDSGASVTIPGEGWSFGFSSVYTMLWEEGWEDADRTMAEVSGSLGEPLGFLVEASAGACQDSRSTRAQGSLFAQSPYNAPLFARAGWRRADLLDTVEPFGIQTYNTGASMGAWREETASDDISLYLRWSDTDGRFYAASKFLYGFLTDGNRRFDGMAEAGYLPAFAPGLKVIYTYALFGMEEPAPATESEEGAEDAYYDPKLLENHLLRIEYERGFAGWARAGGMAAAGYMPESGGVSGTLFLFLSAESASGWRARIDLRGYAHDEGVERDGDGGYYRAAQALLTLGGRF